MEPDQNTHRSRFGTRDLLTTYGNGRTCDDAACDVVLSRYNDEAQCALHAPTNDRG